MTEANQHSSDNVTVFFCYRIDPDQDANRRMLEKELGSAIRFFPLPCSGRLEALHLLKAIETGARKVFVLACPVGSCRYGQGNMRARKRVEYARKLVREVGLPGECIEMVHVAAPLPVSIDAVARQLLGLRAQSDRPVRRREWPGGMAAKTRGAR